MDNSVKKYVETVAVDGNNIHIKHNLNTPNFTISIYKHNSIMWDYTVGIIDDNEIILSNLTGEFKIVIIG
ncbi:hypothetical protein OQZ33_07170 [Pedobacter sp. MC2016-05]|uniref:hypothetical protein n=1 Tax=Pedobacter sp. MC2016-05 TaxID=2994474 RepID=UPI00224664FA|nr:hypothetical protein [Pedobacter sp. MC2016-05]MCX2474106.1 hypothetical protein [Pedobacter sp. MC2016-05]